MQSTLQLFNSSILGPVLLYDLGHYDHRLQKVRTLTNEQESRRKAQSGKDNYHDDAKHNRKKTHHNMMTNDKRIRIARRIINHNKKEPAQRIAIVEQKTYNDRDKKEPAQRITITEQKTNNNHDRKKAIINNKMINSARRISITKQEGINNQIKKDQRITIVERRKLADKRITIAKQKTDHYPMTKKGQSRVRRRFTIASQRKGTSQSLNAR